MLTAAGLRRHGLTPKEVFLTRNQGHAVRLLKTSLIQITILAQQGNHRQVLVLGGSKPATLN